MGKRDYRKGALQFGFQVIPKDVLAMPEFHGLPASAKALMLDLMGQYTGKNNGRLCPAFKVMQRTGWTSKTTLLNAKVALMDMPFAVMTRKGHAPRTVDWIGFTWWKLDYENSMDLDPRAFPYLNFMRVSTDPNVGRELAKKISAVVPKLDRSSLKVASRGTETGPMARANVSLSVQKLDTCKSETTKK